METILRFLVDLVQPSAQLMLLAILAGWFYWKKKVLWGRRFTIVTILLLFIYSTPFLPRLLAWSLERQYPVWNLSHEIYPDHIPVMVLGAGFTADTTLHPSHRMSENLVDRLMEGIRVYRALESYHPLLVLSGTAPEDVPMTQAEVQMHTALDLGVRMDDIRLHDGPDVVNTASEARIFSEKFGKDQKLILVTSAIHMPRAMYWFRHYGLDPIPAPSEFLVKKDAYRRNWNFWPSAEYIVTMDRVYHEVVGMVWARIIT